MKKSCISNLDVVELNRFLQGLPWTELENIAAPFFCNSKNNAVSFLKTLQSEARLGLRLIKSSINLESRVLEVGSGMGLLAGYLNSKGINITALEPGLGGFSVSTALADAVSGCTEFKTLKRLNVSAEELSPKNVEEFDFIYSVNVLEHIPELEKAMQGMRNVLTNQGKMMHTCPNYTVPYEPHFGIPLIPFFPRLTPFIYSQCKNSELWDSFNFITASQIERICSRNSMNIRFDASVLHRSFLRLEEDPEFLKRQSNSLVGTIFKILKSTGLINITRFIPAKLATPMVCVITTNQKN